MVRLPDGPVNTKLCRQRKQISKLLSQQTGLQARNLKLQARNQKLRKMLMEQGRQLMKLKHQLLTTKTKCLLGKLQLRRTQQQLDLGILTGNQSASMISALSHTILSNNKATCNATEDLLLTLASDASTRGCQRFAKGIDALDSAEQKLYEVD